MRKTILLSVLLFLATHAYALTRGEIVWQARNILRDTDTTNVRWSTGTLNIRADIAETEFVKASRCVIKTTYTTTTANTVEYSLPTDWISPLRIAYAIKPLTTTTTNYKRIEFMTLDGLDNPSKGITYWEDATADYPSKYYYTNTNKIGLYPKPSSTYAGANFLKLTYYAFPAAMSSDASVPFEGYRPLYPYHMALVWYICYLCALDEGNMEKAAGFLGKFDLDIARAKGELNDKDDRRGGFAPK